MARFDNTTGERLDPEETATPDTQRSEAQPEPSVQKQKLPAQQGQQRRNKRHK